MFTNILLTATLLSLVSSTPINLTPRATCADMTVIFARGTTETGDLGTLVGPPVQSAIQSAISPKTLNMMGVPAPAYTADIPGFLAGGSATGSAAMASMVQSAMQACPDTKMVIMGYSQGGQLVHNAAKSLPASVTSNSMAVIFGDPDNGKAVQGVSSANTLIVCHTGDNICQGGDTILAPHLTYGTMNAGQAAAFVKKQSGL